MFCGRPGPAPTRCEGSLRRTSHAARGKKTSFMSCFRPGGGRAAPARRGRGVPSPSVHWDHLAFIFKPSVASLRAGAPALAPLCGGVRSRTGRCGAAVSRRVRKFHHQFGGGGARGSVLVVAVVAFVRGTLTNQFSPCESANRRTATATTRNLITI